MNINEVGRGMWRFKNVAVVSSMEKLSYDVRGVAGKGWQP
jgi:hypothetical protein